MTQEIELYSKIQNPVEAIERIGSFLAKSGMFGCERTEQGMVLAMACLAERKSPIEIKRRYHLFQGELSMRADAMLADFRTKAGGKHKIVSRTPSLASVELSLDGNSYLFEFGWADAEKEPFIYDRHGKVKTNYATPRARMQMLWARAVSDGVHAVAPEIVAGVYTPEELGCDTEDASGGLLASTTRTELSPEAKAARIIDINPATTPTNEPQSPPPTPPTTTATATAALSPDPDKSKTAAVPKIDPQTGRLSVETVQALQDAIGEDNAALALTWLETNKRIPPQGTLFDLSFARAKAILEKPQAFLKAIGAAIPGTCAPIQSIGAPIQSTGAPAKCGGAA